MPDHHGMCHFTQHCTLVSLFLPTYHNTSMKNLTHTPLPNKKDIIREQGSVRK